MSKPRRRQTKTGKHASRGAEGAARRRRLAIGAAATLAVAVAVAGVVAVRAAGSGRTGQAGRIHLYQGERALGGATVSLAEVLGKGEPAVVNFWASNCPPCRMEMPGFQRVYAAHGGQGYVMLGVDVGPQTGLGTHEGARALLDREDIGYPVGYAEGDDIVVRYGLRGMPTTLFFDASGRQVGRVVGYLPESQFRSRLAALLAGE